MTFARRIIGAVLCVAVACASAASSQQMMLGEAGVSYGIPTWKQTLYATSGAGIASGSTISFTPTTAGSILLLFLLTANTGRTLSASDAQGSYSSAISLNIPAQSSTAALLYLQNAAAVAKTITVSSSTGTDFLFAAVVEYANVPPSGAIAATASNTQNSPGSGTGAVTSGSYSTGPAGNIVVGFGNMLNPPTNQTLSAASGTSRSGGYINSGNLRYLQVEDQVATGTDASTFTSSLGTEFDLVFSVSLQ